MFLGGLFVRLVSPTTSKRSLFIYRLVFHSVITKLIALNVIGRYFIQPPRDLSQRWLPFLYLHLMRNINWTSRLSRLRCLATTAAVGLRGVTWLVSRHVCCTGALADDTECCGCCCCSCQSAALMNYRLGATSNRAVSLVCIPQPPKRNRNRFIWCLCPYE